MLFENCFPNDTDLDDLEKTSCQLFLLRRHQQQYQLLKGCVPVERISQFSGEIDRARHRVAIAFVFVLPDLVPLIRFGHFAVGFGASPSSPAKTLYRHHHRCFDAKLLLNRLRCDLRRH